MVLWLPVYNFTIDFFIADNFNLSLHLIVYGLLNDMDLVFLLSYPTFFGWFYLPFDYSKKLISVFLLAVQNSFAFKLVLLLTKRLALTVDAWQNHRIFYRSAFLISYFLFGFLGFQFQTVFYLQLNTLPSWSPFFCCFASF